MKTGNTERTHSPDMDQTAGRVHRNALYPAWIALALIVVSFLLSGCISATPQGTPGPIITPTYTPEPTATATPEPFGNASNPIILAAVSGESDPAIASANENLAALLSKNSGLSIKAKTYTTYDDVISDMANEKLQVSWMPPLTYLYASKRGLAQAALLANHFGVYEYGSQYLVNASDSYQLFFDPISGVNSADAATALAQFSGKRPCWVDPTSVSGYIVPAGILALNNIQTAEPAFSQSHTAVVRSLFVQGVCDFGATFSVSGDPRTGSSVQKDLPNAVDRIPIVWRSDPVIPNLCIAYLSSLPEDRAKRLTEAFLEAAKAQDGRDLLSASAGNYQVDDLKSIEDSRFEPLRALVDVLNINLSGMVGK